MYFVSYSNMKGTAETGGVKNKSYSYRFMLGF